MFLASHEFRMLKKVEPLTFTPSRISRGSDALPTINYRLIEGTSKKEIAAKSQVPESFFSRLFSDIKTLHEHGVVHMDLGNSGNILVSGEGHPAIIDFGSAMSLGWLPSAVQNWARRRNYRKNIYTPKRFFKALRKPPADFSATP